MQMAYSVIIPIFNAETTLRRCLDSLVDQSFDDYELLLINDGSTDGSDAICREYANVYPCIRYFAKENGGVSSARNLGLEQAKGEYILFVDSDDYILPTMYEKLIYSMSRYKAQIVSCQYFTFCTNDILKEKVVETKGNRIQGKFCDKQEIFKFFFTHRISESVCDKIYSAELLKNCRFSEGEINEDTNVIFHLLEKSSKTVIIYQELYGYRTRQGSITKSGYSDNFKIVETHLNEIKRIIIQRYPEMVPYLKHFYSVHYFCLLNGILHLESSRKYLEDYKIYRRKFKQLFKFFYKWEKRSIKEYILGFFLISPLSLIYIIYTSLQLYK